MKRRELKKTITFLTSELMAECVALSNFGELKNPGDLDNVMKNIILMQNEMITRLSHVEPGSTKLFFKKLREDIVNQTDEIVEQIKMLA